MHSSTVKNSHLRRKTTNCANPQSVENNQKGYDESEKHESDNSNFKDTYPQMEDDSVNKDDCLMSDDEIASLRRSKSCY